MKYTSLEQAIEKLNEIEAKSSALTHAMGILNVDGETVAPKASVEGRGRTLGVLSELEYTLSTDPENLELAAYILENAPGEDRPLRRRAELMKKQAEETARIPKEEYVAYSMLVNDAQAVWEKAKNENDFASFAPYFEKLVEFNRKLAGWLSPELSAYDALLNEYEEGMTTAVLDLFFQTLQAFL